MSVLVDTFLMFRIFFLLQQKLRPGFPLKSQVSIFLSHCLIQWFNLTRTFLENSLIFFHNTSEISMVREMFSTVHF